jgi:hypothetical protein
MQKKIGYTILLYKFNVLKRTLVHLKINETFWFGLEGTEIKNAY